MLHYRRRIFNEIKIGHSTNYKNDLPANATTKMVHSTMTKKMHLHASLKGGKKIKLVLPFRLIGGVMLLVGLILCRCLGGGCNSSSHIQLRLVIVDRSV